ncbi:MAG: ASCH domain-containing protein [Clostridia bacterium]|nr:ASCH domain-containing protein [Clostridia bacterium]
MHFLAIDLEACNMYVKGSVFSIGVVCADENFNILFKRDILINPKCKFVTKFRKPIEFSIDKESIKDMPTLLEQYESLSELFAGDNIILAHSANNDMYMLNAACKRADVPPFKFEFICTQTIYSAVYDVQNGIGLDAAAERLSLNFTHHKADDDAEMALFLLKNCCDYMQCDYNELEKKLGITRGSIDNYDMKPMKCKALEQLRNAHKLEYINSQKKLLKEIKKNNSVTMNVEAKYFDLIKSGIKKIELRLNDEKRQSLSIGNTLYLVKSNGNAEIIKTIITDMIYCNSFVEILEKVDRVQIGFRSDTELSYLEKIYELYSIEKEREYGVVAIQFEQAK